MAGNKKIFDLPLRTGVTADDRLAIVDSGNTTTYSVKLSDLQDGTGVNTLESLTGNITFSGTNIDITTSGQTIYLSGSTGGGGASGVTGDTLNDNISSVNSIVGTPNIFSGTTGYVNFGYGNKVWDDGVIYGSNNVPTRASVPAGEICIGMDNDYHSNFGGAEGGNMVIGKNNTKRNDGIIIGKSNVGSRGIYLGRDNSSNNSNDVAGMSIFGRNNTSSNVRGTIIGSYNTNAGDFGTILGFDNNHNNTSWGVSVGYANNINSNGSSTLGQNVAIGTSNTITGGLGQFNISVDSDISSTGNYNTIVGGYQNSITGTTSGTTIIGLSGYTATADDMVYVPALNVVNYASLNFADDAAAALGGVELGGLYHNSGAVRIRIT